MHTITQKIIKTSLLIIFFILLSSKCLYSQGFTQEQKDSILNAYVTVPNSNIQIVPPAYFKAFVNDGVFGFMHEGAASSISIQEISGTPYPIVAQSLTKEYLESQKMKLITKENIKTKAQKEAVIFLVSFPVKSKDSEQEMEYERMMLFTGDYNRTIWINANYPAVARKVLFAPLKESLLSVKFD
ncbi:MAG: hypothetical protein PHR81_06205 [Bacteroidales bacterium]|jgi:hypothetical protein|nr:hypothetical protein [Bacteroidales bacterium]MDD4214385.1 hypothetical protein [Bacteroidales bacterium]